MSRQKAPSGFQWRVYRALRRVPNGKVITYKALARRIGIKSARAVGGALAKNPFPLTIPCHRVVNSDKRVGGFSPTPCRLGLTGGRRKSGERFKRDLLKSEGIIFDQNGKIPEKFFIKI